MSEPKSNTDPSMNLSVMASAAEDRTITAAAAIAAAADHDGSSDASSSPTRRSRLVLPNLTPAMQQDLALTKGLGTAKSPRPLSFGARPEFADYPLQGIEVPHPNDVLCGRGGGSNNHPGNESFRELVNEVKVPYVNCPKREKPLIARRIVEAVRNQTPPGRFLCKDIKGLWNDIGDGRAREKTSQALREGAPIIRDMIKSPTDPTDVAAVVKEAKKAERAEKEYCVNMPEETNPIGVQASPRSQPKNEPPVVKCEIGPQVPMINRKNMPNLKKLQDNVAPPAAVWPHAHQAQRNFNLGMPYAYHAGHMMGRFVAPPVLIDYANRASRYPDSVSIETVRRLLLGQIDPVTLALQLLSPQDAAMVARRHANSTVLVNPGPGVMMSERGSLSGSCPTNNPLHLTTIVSDASSRASSGECVVRTGTPSPSDGSSVESSKRSSSETPSKRALPKKKRKYVEEIGL